MTEEQKICAKQILDKNMKFVCDNFYIFLSILLFTPVLFVIGAIVWNNWAFHNDCVKELGVELCAEVENLD